MKHGFEVMVLTGTLLVGVGMGNLLSRDIDPRLLTIAGTLCRGNAGPKNIRTQPVWIDHYDVRCRDGALFDNVLIKLEPETVTVGGAKLPEGK